MEWRSLLSVNAVHLWAEITMKVYDILWKCFDCQNILTNHWKNILWLFSPFHCVFNPLLVHFLNITRRHFSVSDSTWKIYTLCNPWLSDAVARDMWRALESLWWDIIKIINAIAQHHIWLLTKGWQIHRFLWLLTLSLPLTSSSLTFSAQSFFIRTGAHPAYVRVSVHMCVCVCVHIC